MLKAPAQCETPCVATTRSLSKVHPDNFDIYYHSLHLTHSHVTRYLVWCFLCLVKKPLCKAGDFLTDFSGFSMVWVLAGVARNQP